jgi:hypothetical protein
MFQNRKAAEKEAKKIIHQKGHYLNAKGRGKAERRLADEIEKKYDGWARKNVGLD